MTGRGAEKSHISEASVERVTLPKLRRWKEGRRLVMTMAYDAVAARIADPMVDIILAGDSVGNVCLGFDNTLPVSITMMNHHLEAVARTKPRALLGPICHFSAFTSVRRRRYATLEAFCSAAPTP
jgi:3-methyl-2-oxobutanoate hydroxymethyltransferase